MATSPTPPGSGLLPRKTVLAGAKLEELLDVPALRALLEDFSGMSGLVAAILDSEGKVLVATGWQDICTRFHRVCPGTAAACTESDLALARDLARGEFMHYRCRNGLWDVVTPLFVAGIHLGNVYTGQFFYDDEQVDRSEFEARADRYGFDKAAYLEALDRVPRLSRVQVDRIMGFLVKLTDTLSDLALGSARSAEAFREQLRISGELQASEAQYHKLFEVVLHGIVYQDAHGAILSANPAAERILGLSLDQMQGRTSVDPRWRSIHEDGSVFPGEEHPSMVALATGKPVEDVFMGVYNPATGSTTWLNVSAVPLFRDGEARPYQVVATFVDVTERKRAADSQRLSEARLDQAFDASPLGMALLTPQGRFLRVNRTLCHLLAREEAELLAMGFREITHPEDLAVGVASVQDLVEGRIQAFHQEKRYLRGDGEEIWGEVHVSLVRGEAGRPVNLLAQIQDVSGRKAAEHQRLMTLEVLDVLNRTEDPALAARQILRVIQRETGVEAAAIRLAAEDDFTYAAHVGFPEAFIQAENCLRAHSREGEPLFDPEGNPLFECTCGQVLTGRTDPDSHLFTPGGSAWTNDARPFLGAVGDEDPRLNRRNRCILAGYRSVALVPIHSGERVMGLLQLNDSRPGRYDAQLIAFLEGLTSSIGLAISRRQDREKRREAQEHLRLAYEAARAGAWVLDLRTGASSWSKDLYALLGLAPGDLEPAHEGWQQVVDPEQREALANDLAAAVEAGRDLDFEWRARCRDGRILWMLSRAHLERDAEGRPVRFTGITVDISAVKEAEAQRRASEARFSTVFRSVPDPIYILDRESMALLDANEGFEQLTGFSRAEALGRRPSDLGLVADPSDLVRAHEALAQEGRLRGLAIPCRDREGHPFWVELNTSPIELDGRACLIVVARDVTARRQAEEALRESRAMLQLVLDTVPQAVFWKDRRSRYLGCNKAFARMVGLEDPGQVVGLTDFDLSLPREDAKAYRADDREVMGQGRLKPHILEPIRQGDGRCIWIDTTKVPLLDGRGRAFGVLGVSEDISERKRAEEALRESEEKFAMAFQNSPILVSISDPETGELVEVNEAFERVSGFTRAEALGRTTLELGWITPEDRNAMKALLFAHGQLRNREMTLRDRSGRQVTCLVSGELLTIGGRTRVLTAAQDITERVRAEQALQESETRLRTITENAPDIILLVDREGRIQFANRALPGHPREDLTGSEAVLWVPEGQRAQVRHSLEEAFVRQQGTSFPFDSPGPDGATLTYAVRVQPVVLGGEAVSAIFMATDITAVLEAQKALRIKDRALESSLNAIAIADLEGRLTYVNQAFLSLWGLADASEALGRPAQAFWQDPGEAARVLASVARVGSWSGRLKARVAGAAQPDTEIQASLILDEAGRPVGSMAAIQDITEVLQAQEALRESEERWSFALEGSGDGVWDWEVSSGTVYYSRQWKRMLGYGDQEVGDTLEAWSGRIHPEDRALTLAAVQRHLDGVTPHYVSEHRVRCQDGSYKWVLDRGRVVSRDSEGRPVRLIGTHSDITLRRQMEEAVRSSEAWYRALLQTALDGYLVMDSEGVILSANDAYLAITGYPMEELVGLPFAALEAPEAAGETAAHLRQVPTLGRHRFETRQRRSDGGAVDLDVSVQAVSGAEGKLVAFIRDITARKRAEEALRRSEEQYRDIFNNSAEGIFQISKDGRERTVNPAFARMFGYATPEEMVRSSDSLGERLYADPEDRRRLHHLLEGSEGRLVSTEIQFLRQDGEPFWVALHARLKQGQGSDIVEGTSQDITERKVAEENQRMLTAQLHQSQKLESLGSLAGGVAHDLNNVLGAILSLSTTMRTRFLPPDPAASAMDTITKACVRGRDVVRSLLVFARRELEEERAVDLNAMVREMVQLLSHTTLKRVDLAMDLQDALPAVMGDGAALSHAVINLCVNAVDAMPEGGRICIATCRLPEGGRICIATCRLPEGGLCLSVQDTGKGMSPEVLRRATEPFYTTKPTGKGTGLGLSMVYGTLQAHDGDLVIRSEEGRGTRVELRFPASRLAPEQEADSAQAVAPAASRPCRILLVDDEELIRESTTALLECVGHQVATAQDGQEALEMLEAGLDVDLVILDMNMPRLSGAATLPLLLALRPRQAVVIATGYIDAKAEAIRATHPGVRIIGKPFTLEEIQRVVESIMEPHP